MADSESIVTPHVKWLATEGRWTESKDSLRRNNLPNYELDLLPGKDVDPWVDQLSVDIELPNGKYSKRHERDNLLVGEFDVSTSTDPIVAGMEIVADVQTSRGFHQPLGSAFGLIIGLKGATSQLGVVFGHSAEYPVGFVVRTCSVEGPATVRLLKAITAPQLVPKTQYRFSVLRTVSTISVSVDGVPLAEYGSSGGENEVRSFRIQPGVYIKAVAIGGDSSKGKTFSAAELIDLHLRILPPSVLVIGPFDSQGSDRYVNCIQNALRDLKCNVERPDEWRGPGIIIEQVFRRIRTADLVVADLTGANPNVFLEVGYALASGVAIILVSNETTDLPFDIRHLRVLQARPWGSRDELRDSLYRAILGALDIGGRVGL